MQRLACLILLCGSPALAEQPGRSALTLQMLQAQAVALNNSNQLCQMDVDEISKQLTEVRSELEKAKAASK
jgi:hypothetical protein